MVGSETGLSLYQGCNRLKVLADSRQIAPKLEPAPVRNFGIWVVSSYNQQSIATSPLQRGSEQERK